MTYLLILGGLALLILGGETLVRGAVGVARKFGLSELVIGIVLVGFGTSMPELVTSLSAAGEGAFGVSLGNVAGSNIANILLVLGLAALIRPILTDPKALTRDTIVMVLATVVFAWLAYTNGFSRFAGIAMVAALVVYLATSLISDANSSSAPAKMHRDEAEVVDSPTSFGMSLGLTLFGMAAIGFGARFLVDGSVNLARQLGVSETVIGLSIVAIGTSLPEVVTSVIASIRNKADVALGNILGSNIFNVFGIMGVTAALFPFNVPYHEFILSRDLGAMALAAFFLIIFSLTGKQLARWEGAVLLLGFGVYMFMVTIGHV